MTSVDYSFTITLKPKGLFCLEPEQQYDAAVKHINDKLLALTMSHTIVCELTLSYNIHFHGICCFNISRKDKNCQKEWFKCWRNDPYVGFTNLRQVTDKNGWLEYMAKDFDKTYLALNRRPLIYDYLEYYSTADRARYGCTW